MLSLHFWLHCFALWHISSLLVNKPRQVFSFSPLEIYPKQSLEHPQSRSTESGWGTGRASSQPGTELCLGGNWSPFTNMARHGKKAPELYSSARHLWLLALHLHLHGRATTKHMNWEHCWHLSRENEHPDFTMFPFPRTVSRDRRTSGLLNEVVDLESGFSNTNSPLNKIILGFFKWWEKRKTSI